MKSFEETLALASADWVRDGIINAEQRTTLLQRHPPSADRGSRFIGVIATLGGVLFAVGVSLVIKANWQDIGDWTKIAALVALLVAAYVGGWKLKVADGHFAKTGDACLMIGQILFLCGISLVSQIFHLNARPATGVLVWWLGIAVVPWLTRAKGAQFVSVVAGLVWLGMEMTTRGSLIYVGDDRPNWIIIHAVYSLLGLAIWGLGVALRGTRWDEFAGLHEKWGLLTGFTGLFVLGFARHQEWLWRHGHTAAEAWRPVLLAGGLVAAALVVMWRRHREELKGIAPWLAFVPVVAGAAIIPSIESLWVLTVTAWIGSFLLAVGIIRAGLETGREAWVNLGILALAANIIARYFDLFGSRLEGGVFFIFTGVVVTALGILLEKKRRALVATVRKEVAS